MAKTDSPDLIRLNEELLRLTFCATIIATFFASVAAGDGLARRIGPSGAQAASTVLGLSAAFGFGYFLSVAAALKYEGRYHVDRFPLSPKMSRFLYDASVNIFGIFVLVLLVAWVAQDVLHLPSTPWLWPLYLVLFGVLYFVVRAAWALAQLGIEQFYDFTNRRKS